MDKTIKEADKAFKEGKAQITTGVFKWSKDYNSAVTYFDEAVTLYVKAGCWEKALLALEKCKLCNEKQHEIWGTARNLEKMVTILIDNIQSKEYQKIIEIATEACQLFKGADSFTECIKLKQKIAKYLVQNSQTEPAIQLLESGIDDAEASDKAYNKKEIFEQYLEIIIDLGQYSKAITMIKKQFTNPTDTKNRFQTASYGLCIVILCLLDDESLRAEQEFNSLCSQIPGFYSEREYEVSEQLIKAFNERNQEEFTKLATKPSVTNIYPSNITRILRKKKLKAPIKKVQQEQPQQMQNNQYNNDPNNFLGQNSQQQQQQEDDYDQPENQLNHKHEEEDNPMDAL